MFCKLKKNLYRRRHLGCLHIFAPVVFKIWVHSSAGSEHLPYKQGVTGSNPVEPTPPINASAHRLRFFLSCVLFETLLAILNWYPSSIYFQPFFIEKKIDFSGIKV